MIVVELGDQYVSHSGSTGGLRMGGRVKERDEELDEVSGEITEERLRPWIKTLESLNLTVRDDRRLQINNFNDRSLVIACQLFRWI